MARARIPGCELLVVGADAPPGEGSVVARAGRHVHAIPGGRLDEGCFTVEAAQAGEGEWVARAIRRSLDPDLVDYTIWRSPRAGRYVESLLRGRVDEGHAAFYLLRRGRASLGLAAFRTLDGAAFLNHLWVAPEWQGQGLGRLLLLEAARLYHRRHPAPRLALEVFAGRPAEAWYRRLGFVESERRSWWRGPSLPSPEAPLLPCHGLAGAARRHRAWGFSSFRAGPYRVGRLWTPYFRLTDPAALRDPALLATLARLDPARRPFLVAPFALPHPWYRVAVSKRMECSADLFFERVR